MRPLCEGKILASSFFPGPQGRSFLVAFMKNAAFSADAILSRSTLWVTPPCLPGQAVLWRAPAKIRIAEGGNLDVATIRGCSQSQGVCPVIRSKFLTRTRIYRCSVQQCLLRVQPQEGCFGENSARKASHSSGSSSGLNWVCLVPCTVQFARLAATIQVISPRHVLAA